MRRPAQPTVSVIIPAYNYGRFIGQAIDSVLAQTYPVKEIIVVDDGSTDDTFNVLAKYGQAVRALRQQNRGPAAARNEGAKNASGELLAFLDADDVWLSDKLTKQVRKLLEGKFGLVHCGLRVVDHCGRTLRDELDGMQGWVYADILRWEQRVVLGPGSTSLVPRRIYVDELGGMDESLQVSEDLELVCRLARRYQIGFVAEPLVMYRQHEHSNRCLNVACYEPTLREIFSRAFRDKDPELLKIRALCYGNLHIRIAIALFGARAYRRCVLNLALALWFRPRLVVRPFRFALKRITRLFHASDFHPRSFAQRRRETGKNGE